MNDFLQDGSTTRMEAGKQVERKVDSDEQQKIQQKPLQTYSKKRKKTPEAPVLSEINAEVGDVASTVSEEKIQKMTTLLTELQEEYDAREKQMEALKTDVREQIDELDKVKRDVREENQKLADLLEKQLTDGVEPEGLSDNLLTEIEDKQHLLQRFKPSCSSPRMRRERWFWREKLQN